MKAADCGGRKRETLRYVGSMEQLASIRKVRMLEGAAKGLDFCRVTSGDISFLVSLDRGMDIAELAYRGAQLGFLSKPGLQNGQGADIAGPDALRTIMGGMLFTCGLDNVGPAGADAGGPLPMHGRIRQLPAKHISADASWEAGQYVLSLKGELRQSALFSENLCLRRRIETHYGSNSISIHDEIENQGFAPAPLMLLYHFNIGYPLLTERARLLLPSVHCTDRDDPARRSADDWAAITAPADNLRERVYYHRLEADEKGESFAAVVNEDLGAGIKLVFSTQQLPFFTQWKSMGAGDYAMGLEPGNCRVEGRAKEAERLEYLAPLQSKNVDIKLVILDREKGVWPRGETDQA